MSTLFWKASYFTSFNSSYLHQWGHVFWVFFVFVFLLMCVGPNWRCSERRKEDERQLSIQRRIAMCDYLPFHQLLRCVKTIRELVSFVYMSIQSTLLRRNLPGESYVLQDFIIGTRFVVYMTFKGAVCTNFSLKHYKLTKAINSM